MSNRIVAVMLCCVALLAVSGGAYAQEAKEQDPWEGFNRAMFTFNDTLDGYVLKPVAKGYKAVTPDFAEKGVSNFFGNLLEIRNVLNDVLQWKWGQAGNDSGRFLINTTLGIGGLFDVAKHMKLPKSEGEDFGQTLAVWGLGSGPYLVLPFLGPSSVRDGAGLPLDWSADPISYIDHVPTRNSTRAFKFVVDRADLLTAEEFISGDRYIFIREAYLQRRNYLINDGEIDDPFAADPFSAGFDEEGEQ